MANLTSSFLGIKSPNPFWLASAPPTDKQYNVERAFKAGWGGVVWKTLGAEGPPIVNVQGPRYGAIHSNDRRLLGLNNIELIEKLIEEPYQVNGKWFYPYDYKKFEEIGLAQLETSLKNGSKTKNGEYYHNDTLTGAHRSLPLPSIIEVTNLNNGKSALVRVNHREAFSSIKVVNLSEAVFKKLDMNQNGDLVKISLIDSNESFVLSEAYTYDEEKKIVEAPVSSVVVIEKDKNELSVNDTNIKNKSLYNKIFINIASFAFKESAQKIKTVSYTHLTLPTNREV